MPAGWDVASQALKQAEHPDRQPMGSRRKLGTASDRDDPGWAERLASRPHGPGQARKQLGAGRGLVREEGST